MISDYFNKMFCFCKKSLTAWENISVVDNYDYGKLAIWTTGSQQRHHYSLEINYL